MSASLCSHGTLPSHRLGGVHRHAVPYSARRESQTLNVPQRVRLEPSFSAAAPEEWRVSVCRGWAGENSGHFDRPVRRYSC
jgi:hypothetical protein